MTEDLQRDLADRYPALFRDLGGDPEKTCMARGVTCGDGWFKILDRLCAELAAEAGGHAGIRFAQIKEKFGGLKVYLEWGDTPIEVAVIINRHIKAAAWASLCVCEDCGRSDRTVATEGAWIRTLCGACRVAFDAKEGPP